MPFLYQNESLQPNIRRGPDYQAASLGHFDLIAVNWEVSSAVGGSSRAGRKVSASLASALLLAVAGYWLSNHVALLGLTVWVARLRHADIKIVAFDDRGNSLSSVEFFRTWRPALIVRDMNHQSRFGIQHGLGPILVAVPADETVTLELLWPVPGFGKVLVRADNGGQGFRGAPDRSMTLELVPDLARSRIRELRRWIVAQNGGRPASPAAEDGLELANSVMREVERTRDLRRRNVLAYHALRAALEASEQEVLAEARDSIERNRQGTISVTMLDSRGRPLANARVHADQKRFDFLFGAYHDGYQAGTIDRMHVAGLNYATLHLDWLRTEPHEGVFDFKRIDREFPTRALQEHGFTMRGHALVWLSSAGMPSWMKPLRGDRAALCAAVKRHLDAVLTHYRDADVQIWEANNEGHAVWARWGLDSEAMIDVVRTAAKEIREQSPNSQIMINLALPLGEDLSLKYYPLISQLSEGRIDDSAIDPYSFALQLERAGVLYDLLGLQIYSGAWVGVRGGVQVPAIDLFRFATLLKRYERLGKPIQITEIAAPSTDRGTLGESFWHAPPNPATQADYLAGVFTIAYGNPQVCGINWWDFYDQKAFVDSGGLFDRYLNPKPAYRRLQQLLAGWRYEGDLVTDTHGVAQFQGPSGEYRFTAENGSACFSAEAHLKVNSPTVVTLREANPRDLGHRAGEQAGFGSAAHAPRLGT